MSAKTYSVVETDNYGGDYPDESFLVRYISEQACVQIAAIMNKEHDADKGGSRFWKVVKDPFDKPYKLKPGFQPWTYEPLPLPKVFWLRKL